MRSKIDQIGGWPVIDPHWNEDDHDLQESLIKAARFKYFPLVKFEVINNLKNPTQNIIAVNLLLKYKSMIKLNLVDLKLRYRHHI